MAGYVAGLDCPLELACGTVVAQLARRSIVAGIGDDECACGGLHSQRVRCHYGLLGTVGYEVFLEIGIPCCGRFKIVVCDGGVPRGIVCCAIEIEVLAAEREVGAGEVDSAYLAERAVGVLGDVHQASRDVLIVASR